MQFHFSFRVMSIFTFQYFIPFFLLHLIRFNCNVELFSDWQRKASKGCLHNCCCDIKTCSMSDVCFSSFQCSLMEHFSSYWGKSFKEDMNYQLLLCLSQQINRRYVSCLSCKKKKRSVVLLGSILELQAEIKGLSTATSINLALATNALIYLRKE